MKNSFLPQKQLLQLVDHLPGSLCRYCEWPDGRTALTYFSSAPEKLLIAETEELEKDASSIWDQLSSDSAKKLRAEIDESRENQAPLKTTFTIRSKQGDLRRIRIHAIPENQADESTIWCGHIEDITPQYDAKEFYNQQAATLSMLFKALPDHIYHKDLDHKMVSANPACCKYHQASHRSVIGKTALELYPNEIGRQKYEEERHLLKTGETLRKQETVTEADGTTTYFSTVKTPLKNTRGQIIGFAGVSRDITEQVESEKALILAKKEADESIALLETILASMPDQLYYKDMQSRMVKANAAWFKHHNISSASDMIGKTPMELTPGPLGEETYEREQAQLNEGTDSRVRSRHERHDGKIVFLESIKTPCRNKKGDVLGLVGISRDITQQVKAEEELISAKQEADAANKAKSQFLAMMSHEIRTPMNGVIGAASLLNGTLLTDEQTDFVNTIQSSGDNLLNIINDILDYSKIEAGKINLEAIPFNLRECIENTFDLFVHTASSKKIELLYYVEPDVPCGLIGDPTRLRQIITNLLGNAVKFTDSGEISLRVNLLTTDTKTDSCQLHISVRDTGIGISEEACQRLFHSFTQADASSTRKYGGTGLGLAISKRLTELMGGRIWVNSIVGGGSTFHFTINQPIASSGVRKSHQPVSGSLTGKRVLIVDDNETNRSILCAQMTQWGALPLAFEHPDQIIPHLDTNPEYDIALLDFQMPSQNGSDLAKNIKNHPGYTQLPIIILSSAYESIEADPAINIRMSKPVRIHKLQKNMLRLLGTKKAAEKRPAQTQEKIAEHQAQALRILIAEDNPVNQRVLYMMLKRLGYCDTTFVTDGQQAIDSATEKEYDLILMDIQMPKVNGLKATQQIRAHYQSKTSPWIVALTAAVMDEERAEIRQAGLNDFIAKPLGIEQLAKKLSAIHGKIAIK